MEKHTIEITAEGAVTIKVQGVKGSTCQDATREIEDKLGSKLADKPTKEMYEQPSKLHNRNRA